MRVMCGMVAVDTVDIELVSVKSVLQILTALFIVVLRLCNVALIIFL